MITIAGQHYALKKPTEGELAFWELMVEELRYELWNPVRIFLSRLEGLPSEIQAAAVTGFCSRECAWPTYVDLLAKNSLESVRALVAMLTSCDPNAVTAANLDDVVAQLQLNIDDPELAKILEIERHRQDASL